MLWCLIFMCSGALIFAAGAYFEREASAFEDETAEEEERAEPSPFVMKQWENLLGYDGNEQEVYDENN